MSKEDTPKAWLGYDSCYGRLLAGSGDLVPRNGLVPPGSTILITNRPQLPFRGRRLFVHQPIASSFLIHDVKVGQRAMTASFGPIPADAFATRLDQIATVDALFKQHEVFELKIGKRAAEMLGSEWTLPRVEGGMADITMMIENISAEPLRFIGAWMGDRDPDVKEE